MKSTKLTTTSGLPFEQANTLAQFGIAGLAEMHKVKIEALWTRQTSPSMLPVLWGAFPGCQMLTEANPEPEGLAPGQIVRFKREGGAMVVHMLLRRGKRRGKRGWITQGLNNTHPDREVMRPEQLRGRLCGVVWHNPETEATQ